MSDDTPYMPDQVLKERTEANRAKPKPSVTIDKPVSFRVARTRPNTQTKHYPRKRGVRPTIEQFDPRRVKFY